MLKKKYAPFYVYTVSQDLSYQGFITAKWLSYEKYI